MRRKTPVSPGSNKLRGTEEALREALAELEARRSVLGDAVVDAAVRPLFARLAELEAAGLAAAGTDTAADRSAIKPDTGLRLDSGQAEAERKLITALFADFAGYTTLVQKGDPEEVRELLGAAFSVLVPVIERYDGTIEKFMGDGVMALFGAPRAHEDDAARACRAALEMRAALRGFNEARGSSLALHFGLGTGMVVAGRFGVAGHQSYSAVGSAVNRAARLSALSMGGEIFVDSDTAARTAGLFAFTERAPAALKGFDEPVRIFSLDAVAPAPGQNSEFLPFVGREVELSALKAAWNRLMAEGRGGLCLLSGEAGIGKSRLIREWLSGLAQEGEFGPHARSDSADATPLGAAQGGSARLGHAALVLKARARAYDSESACRFWIGFLEELSGIAPWEDSESRRERLEGRLSALGLSDRHISFLCTLADSLSVAESQEADEDEASEYPAHDFGQATVAFKALLEALSRGGPLVFAAEDFHAADAASKRLLVELARSCAELPYFWLLAARKLDTPSQDELAAIFPGSKGLFMALEALGADSVTELLASFDSGQSPQDIKDKPALTHSSGIMAAGGNPLFLEEILRARARLPGGRMPEPGIEGLPPALFSLIATRLDALPERSREALKIAAVLGEEFPVGLLKALSGYEGLEALRTLEEEGFLSLSAEAAAFRHDLVRQAVYACLLEKTRRERHAEAARAIKDLYPDFGKARPDIMARHWLAAGEKKRALPHLKIAGRELADRGDFAGAAELYASGLAAARTTSSTFAQAEFAALLGPALARLGRLDEALAVLDEALGIQRALSNRSREVAIERSRASIHARSGRRAEAESIALRCLALVEGGSEEGRDGVEAQRIRARLHADLAELYQLEGRTEAALAEADTAILLTQAVKALVSYRRLLFLRGTCLEALERKTEAASAYLRCAEVASLSGAASLERDARARTAALG